MQIQARALYDQVKRSGDFGPEAQRKEVSQEQAGHMYMDEFMSEFANAIAMDNSDFLIVDRNPEKGKIEIQDGEMTMKSEYTGNALEGGHIDTSGTIGKKEIYFYHELDGEKGEMRLVGIASDEAGQVDYAALFTGNLNSEKFAVETLGDTKKMAEDGSFSNVAQYLLAG